MQFDHHHTLYPNVLSSKRWSMHRCHDGTIGYCIVVVTGQQHCKIVSWPQHHHWFSHLATTLLPPPSPQMLGPSGSGSPSGNGSGLLYPWDLFPSLQRELCWDKGLISPERIKWEKTALSAILQCSLLQDKHHWVSCQTAGT